MSVQKRVIKWLTGLIAAAIAVGSALSVNQRNLTALDHILGHGYAMLCAASCFKALTS